MRVSSPGRKVHGRMHLCPTTQTVDAVKQQMKKYDQPWESYLTHWEGVKVWTLECEQNADRFHKIPELSCSGFCFICCYILVLFSPETNVFLWKLGSAQVNIVRIWVWRRLQCCVSFRSFNTCWHYWRSCPWSGAYLLISTKVGSHWMSPLYFLKGLTLTLIKETGANRHTYERFNL